jgi:hypothetical protein
MIASGVMSHKNVTKVLMKMVSGFRCQENTEDGAQKTNGKIVSVFRYMFSDTWNPTPDTIFIEGEI